MTNTDLVRQQRLEKWTHRMWQRGAQLQTTCPWSVKVQTKVQSKLDKTGFRVTTRTKEIIHWDGTRYSKFGCNMEL